MSSFPVFDITSVNIDFVLNLPSVDLDSARSMPLKQGIYFIRVGIPRDRVVYVGMSQCLQRRLGRHDLLGFLRLLCSIDIPVYVSYLELPGWNREDLAIAEIVFIKKFNPFLNFSHSASPLKGKVTKTRIMTLKTFIPQKRQRVERPIIPCHIPDDLENETIRSLKRLAGNLRIEYYGVMTKNELIDAIKARHLAP